MLDLSREDQRLLALEGMRNLDPSERLEVSTQIGLFGPETPPEVQASQLEAELTVRRNMQDYKQRLLIIGVTSAIIVVGFIVVFLTALYASEFTEYVGGVITTVTGAIAGFIGGRATAGDQSGGGSSQV